MVDLLQHRNSYVGFGYFLQHHNIVHGRSVWQTGAHASRSHSTRSHISSVSVLNSYPCFTNLDVFFEKNQKKFLKIFKVKKIFRSKFFSFEYFCTVMCFIGFGTIFGEKNFLKKKFCRKVSKIFFVALGSKCRQRMKCRSTSDGHTYKVWASKTFYKQSYGRFKKIYFWMFLNPPKIVPKNSNSKLFKIIHVSPP